MGDKVLSVRVSNKGGPSSAAPQLAGQPPPLAPLPSTANGAMPGVRIMLFAVCKQHASDLYQFST
jgi:hypothetical protein